MAYTTKLVMKPNNEILKRLNLEEKGEVQKFFTSTCAKAMDKYVPFKSGDLASYTIHGNEIWYDQLYAQYQYKGEREDGTHKINPANRTRIYHPLATSYWDKVMWSIDSPKVIAQVDAFIKLKAKKGRK
jgi:hypothetical protein